MAGSKLRMLDDEVLVALLKGELGEKEPDRGVIKALRAEQRRRREVAYQMEKRGYVVRFEHYRPGYVHICPACGRPEKEVAHRYYRGKSDWKPFPRGALLCAWFTKTGMSSLWQLGGRTARGVIISTTGWVAR